MKEFLGLVVKNNDGYSGMVPELSVLAVGDSLDEVKQALSEGIALHLEDEPDAAPAARTLNDLDAETRGDYDGLEPIEVLVQPAEMNPVSLELERAIEDSGLSYREVARRMGTGHAAVSRMTNPFYWGHSVSSLRKLADVLGLQVQVKLSAA